MTHAQITEQRIRVDTMELRVQRIRVPRAEADTARPVLVFLHDSLGCVETWRDFPRSLAEQVGLDAIAYDREGYGQSSEMPSIPRTAAYLELEAERLFRLLDALETRDVILVGHSDGGSIALIAAALQPGRVRGIITEGAHVFVEEETLAGIRAALELFATTDLAERLARHHGNKVDALRAPWIDTWLSPMFRDWNIERFLGGSTCPALIVQGELDDYGTPNQVRAIVEGLGNRAERLMLPGVAHTPHREAREATMRASAAFIGSVMAPTTGA